MAQKFRETRHFINFSGKKIPRLYTHTHTYTHTWRLFAEKNFVNKRLTTNFMKLLYHENLELYSTSFRLTFTLYIQVPHTTGIQHMESLKNIFLMYSQFETCYISELCETIKCIQKLSCKLSHQITKITFLINSCDLLHLVFGVSV